MSFTGIDSLCHICRFARTADRPPGDVVTVWSPEARAAPS
jgi:hypothetical protein